MSDPTAICTTCNCPYAITILTHVHCPVRGCRNYRASHFYGLSVSTLRGLSEWLAFRWKEAKRR